MSGNPSKHANELLFDGHYQENLMRLIDERPLSLTKKFSKKAVHESPKNMVSKMINDAA
jgi:hypothetical protein